MKTSRSFRVLLLIPFMLLFIGAFPALGAEGIASGVGDGSTDYGRGIPTNAVAIGATPTGLGYWILDDAGQIYSFGDAQYYGGGIPPGAAAVAIGVTPTGKGYWILNKQGQIYCCGDAVYNCFADHPPIPDSVAIGVTPTGKGYWILDDAGEIYSFGDAYYYGGGSPGAAAVDIGVTPTGKGYWILDAAGQIYSFGDAYYYVGGSPGAAAVDIGVTPTGKGYWILDAAGQTYAVGDAQYYGNSPPPHYNSPKAVSIGVTPIGLNDPPSGKSKGGYWILTEIGQIYSFNAKNYGRAGDSVADAHVLFLPPQNIDIGITPSVAMNNNNYVVSIHKGHATNGLYYMCGYVHPNDTVTWWSSGIRYDTGMCPSVAMNDKGWVVEVHQGHTSSALYYHVGAFNSTDGIISWGPSYPYDTGTCPSIAVTNNGYVVEVHKGHTSSDMYYHVGAIDFPHAIINWGPSHKYDIGITPTVAMTDAGYVVEVHQGHTSSDLYYHVGACDFPRAIINWGPSYAYDTGITPSVAMTDDGYVVEAHQGHTSGNLYYNVGQCKFPHATISWGPGRNFDTGITPSVALNQNYAVQIHESQDNAKLWCSSALLLDHSRWMEDLRDVIGDRALWEITLPGTHDAGMYFARPDILIHPYSWTENYTNLWVCKNWVTTQGESIYQQLMGGVRYFDLRPAWYDKTLFIYHSFAGPQVDEVFRDIRAFMDSSKASGAGELVILVLSHLYYKEGTDEDFDKAAYEALGNLITNYLKPYLYTVDDPQKANFLATTFNQYTEVNGDRSPRILLLVKSGEYNDWINSGATKPPAGVWPYQEMDYDDQPDPVTGSMRIINDYANTPEPSKMETDQSNKMLYARGGDAERAFLLSWTLTAPDSEDWWIARFAGKPPKSIHYMSQYVKDDLPSFLQKHGDTYKINILFTDYYEEAATPDLAYLMNKGALTDAPGPPVLDIKANGQDDPLLIRPGTPVSLTLTLNPGYRVNLNADWWIVVNTPMGWYSYVNSQEWQQGLTPYDQTALTDLPPPLELPGVSLGTGLYTYYFAIDDNADGLLDARWVDQVDVNVTRWR